MHLYKAFLVGLLFCLCPVALLAQDSLSYRFVNGKELTVLGRAASVDPNTYHRVDAQSQTKLPRRVAELSRQSAGISINFQTNAKNIKVKWVLGKYNTLWNMTPVAVNGLDLYGWRENKWQYIASAKPVADTSEAVFIENLDGVMRHYRIHLPLYAELKEIEVGVNAAALLKKADEAFLPNKKVVIYGSSITQGASASRPGMAYTAILARNMHIDTYNLGFSGSGKMELAVADVLAAMPADVYILDCVPNPSPEEIQSRAVPFVKRLRQLKPHVPIILVESVIREHGYWNAKVLDRVQKQNKAFKEAYDKLKREQYPQLYYIPSDNLIGQDHDATIDGTHLTDAGFLRLAQRVQQTLAEVLQIETAGVKR